MIEDNFRKVVPYVPGEQPKDNDVIKLNTNENPYPPSPSVLDALAKVDNNSFRKYPDPDVTDLVQAIADYHHFKKENVFVGVGSDDVLAMCFLSFFNSGKEILFPDVSYAFYKVWADLFQIKYREVPLDENFNIVPKDYMVDNGGIVFPNPNAPTGLTISLSDIEDIIIENKHKVVIVDEAYIDFGGQSCVPLIHQYENLVVIQTFSKSRSFAGARLGVALGNKEAISHLYDVKNSFNSYPIDYITQQIGIVSVLNSQDMKEKCQKVIQTREYTKTKLKELGFVVPDSYANFVFVKHPKIDGEELFLALRKEGIIVRHWNKPLIDQYLRVTIGTDQQMERFFEFLENYLNQKGLL